jgi:hypothetical protein
MPILIKYLKKNMKTFKEYINENYPINTKLDRYNKQLDRYNKHKNYAQNALDIIDILLKQNKPIPNNLLKFIKLHHSSIWQLGHLFVDRGYKIPPKIISILTPDIALDLITFAINQPQLAKRIPTEILKKLDKYTLEELGNFLKQYKTPNELQEFLNKNKWAIDLVL